MKNKGDFIMKGNAIVLLLPASVMIGLFIFGYISLSQTETISNQDLIHSIAITEEVIDEQTLQIQWQWGDFPEDGIEGDDFIEIILPAELQDQKLNVAISLSQGEKIVYKNDFFVVSDDRLTIAFPNEVQDEKILGPSGEVIVYFSEPILDDWQGQVRYYHTWNDHDIKIDSGIDIEEKLLNEFIQSYWVAKP